MEESLAAQNKQIAENIQRFGWHSMHIFPTKEGQDDFSYSIGFTESYGAPEILIFGLVRDKAHALLNECAHLFKNGHKIILGAEDSEVLSGGYSVVFKSVRSEFFGSYLGTAMRYYQDAPFSAAVMFMPDKDRRFPWDEGYDYISADEALAIV